ncbi:MAG: YggS family pyridoxal phosphate-dependent enzyme [SAR86 cluster bacterium]|uniref:Pyridoxal phosphate homeostasis protein n=1 Tax=SAR86 cluster bacterium TaxID=2030880 RepID=A0A2A4MRH8_9GAMM|nr:MAG: YggS family pyridoxal phosphate-dependent enzyme [SAR86 cluster bacterium]
MFSIAENIHAVCERIRIFEQHYERPANSVSLLAVSKRQSPEKIRQACIAGQTHFGESYLQEALEKIELLSDLDPVWHFIGPIQSNKTAQIARHFHWVHSVDRLRIAQRLNDQRPDHLPRLNVCVQVNIDNEESKSGVGIGQLEALCMSIEQMPRLRLRGLMTIPMASEKLQQQRHSFQSLAQLFKRLSQFEAQFDTLSMGMSGDFEAAIAEGSTMVRVGTALFGVRPSSA